MNKKSLLSAAAIIAASAVAALTLFTTSPGTAASGSPAINGNDDGGVLDNISEVDLQYETRTTDFRIAVQINPNTGQILREGAATYGTVSISDVPQTANAWVVVIVYDQTLGRFTEGTWIGNFAI